LVALGYAAFAGLQGLAPNEWFLTVVRFLLGLAIGISIVVAPAYIAESAPVSVRGSMLVTFQIATTSGIALAYFVGAALAGTESWRLILSLSAIPAIIVLVLIVRLPDTARWLLMNSQREGAADLLRRVEPDMDPDEEVRRIEHDLSYEERGASPSSSRGASVGPASSSWALASWSRSQVSTPSSTIARRSSKRSASRVRRARSSRPASSRLRA